MGESLNKGLRVPIQERINSLAKKYSRINDYQQILDPSDVAGLRKVVLKESTLSIKPDGTASHEIVISVDKKEPGGRRPSLN